MGHIPLDQFDLSDEGFNFYSPAELAEICGHSQTAQLLKKPNE